MPASCSTSGDVTLPFNPIPHMTTIKLSSSNYFLWKIQIVPLLSYNNLLPHIDGSSPSPEPTLTLDDTQVAPNPDYSIWHSADLKAIIILHASLSEEAFAKIIGLTTAQQIWLTLESAYSNSFNEWTQNIHHQLRESEKGTLSVAAYARKFQGYCDQLAAVGYPVHESDKLNWFLGGLGASFDIFFRDVRARQPTLLFKDVLAQAVNKEPYLKSLDEPTLINKLDDPALDAIAPVVSALREDLQYIQASCINVYNFVTVKLSGRSNYRIWADQMSDLIESQALLHIIDDSSPYTGNKSVQKNKQYDKLVKGWILGSMNKNVLKGIEYRRTMAIDVWNEVKFKFNPPKAEDMEITEVLDPQHSLEKMLDNFIDAPEMVNIQTNANELTEVDPNDPESLGFSFEKDLFKDTPNSLVIPKKKILYKAAVEGCWWKAKYLLKANTKLATEAITSNGNTILHIAVEMGQNHFVEKLLEFLKDGKGIETENFEGQTALHIAAMVGNEYAAQLLLQKREKLLETLDNNGETALDTAISQSKLNICAYLLKFLSSDLRNSKLSSAVGAAFVLKRYDLVLTFLKNDKDAFIRDEWLLLLMTITFPTDLDFKESFIYPSFNNVHQKAVERCSLLFHPGFWDKCVDDILRVGKIYNSTCYNWFGKFSIILLVPIATLYSIYQLISLLLLGLRLTLSTLYLLLWNVLAVTVHPIKNIEKKKKEYGDAREVLSIIISRVAKDPYRSAYRESILEAVRIGAYEVVDEILYMSPSTINTKDKEGHNIIQLAIINRSEKVYNLLHHMIVRTKFYRTMKDSSKNNLVHLAGRKAPSFVLGRTTGAALQLQRELLWQKEVEKFILPLELRKENHNKETPAMLFTREHENLMKEGEIWMKTTAESCSITAALIVTVVFAAAITVPGGSNQESGIPVFKKEIAFTIFALSNAFSLFTSASSLLLFLSILTARFSEKDFLVSLPRRLILGLLTLFLSTTAMILAFGAILFLVFCDQRPWMLAPIAVFACLPISVIVTIKMPLLIDLIHSTYFPIFGKHSYLESCKINQKTTMFKNIKVDESD